MAAEVVDPTRVLTRQEGLTSATKAYETFDKREPGWLNVELQPTQQALETGAGAAHESTQLCLTWLAEFEAILKV